MAIIGHLLTLTILFMTIQKGRVQFIFRVMLSVITGAWVFESNNTYTLWKLQDYSLDKVAYFLEYNASERFSMTVLGLTALVYLIIYFGIPLFLLFIKPKLKWTYLFIINKYLMKVLTFIKKRTIMIVSQFRSHIDKLTGIGGYEKKIEKIEHLILNTTINLFHLTICCFILKTSLTTLIILSILTLFFIFMVFPTIDLIFNIYLSVIGQKKIMTKA